MSHVKNKNKDILKENMIFIFDIKNISLNYNAILFNDFYNLVIQMFNLSEDEIQKDK